ncbi:hypothetical protein [Streptomyces sp. NBC_01518]
MGVTSGGRIERLLPRFLCRLLKHPGAAAVGLSESLDEGRA